MALLKEFFNNEWTKRCVSIFSLAFGLLIVFLSYMAVFYDVEITNHQTFGVTISVIILVLGAIMIYTRKNFLTSFISMIAFLLVLPVVIFCWGNWLLLIPLVVLSILMFFLCGASENTKTIVGTIYVMIYIMATIAFFLYSSLIAGQTRDSKSENYVSESGTYRCYIIDTVDSSTGSTKIYVEPNNYDIYYNGIAFIAKDYERIVYNIRERKNINVEWREDDLYVDGELRFRHDDAFENQWFEFKDVNSRIDESKKFAKKFFSKIFKLNNDDEEQTEDSTNLTTEQ